MDPQTVAALAVSLISPYLVKTGEALAKKVGESGGEAAEKAGEAAWDKIKAIYGTVMKKLKGDAYAEQTAKRLEADPQSNSRQAALASVIEEKAREDSSFAQELQRLVQEAQKQGAERIVQQIMISGNAKTGDITQIGKVEGNVNLSKNR